MKRVLVIGCMGAGKTTFALELGKRLNIPVHHLDTYFWKENWTPTPQAEFIEMQNSLMREDEWILEGNFTKSLPNRTKHADTIFLFDLPKPVLFWRVIRRFVRDYNRGRADLGGNNKETVVSLFKLLKYMWRFPMDEIKCTVESFDGKIIVFHNGQEVHTFLSELK